MDLRGLVQLGDNRYVSVGGMQANQEVTDRVVLYTINDLVNAKEESIIHFEVIPTINHGHFELKGEQIAGSTLELINGVGQIVMRSEIYSNQLVVDTNLIPGIYFARILKDQNQVSIAKFIVD